MIAIEKHDSEWCLFNKIHIHFIRSVFNYIFKYFQQFYNLITMYLVFEI